MVSTCPGCLQPVTHSENLLEVACTCGARFFPLSNEEITQNADSLSKTQFLESHHAFQEIRDFGENLLTSKNVETKSNITQPQQSPPIPTPSDHKQIPITSGSILQGYTIMEYLNPVSFWAPLDEEESPLNKAYESLTHRALTVGANAIVSVQIHTVGPQAKALVSGIPVFVRRDV